MPRHRHAIIAWAVLGFALVLGDPAGAQTAEPLSTDRPDFTESPLVVGSKVWQVESGLLWSRTGQGDVSAKGISLPNALFRLGMSNRLELRAGTPGLVRANSGGARASWQTSTGDLEVGAKYQLAHQAGLGLDVGVVAFVGLALDGASNANVDPSVKLAWGRNFGSLSLTGNFNWSAPTTAATDRRRVLEASVSVGRGFGASWGGFVEGVASDVDDADTPAAWTANAGVTRLFGRNLQVDVHMGRGVNDAASGWSVGAGLARRFFR